MNNMRYLIFGCAALISASMIIAPTQAYAKCKSYDAVCKSKEAAKKAAEATKRAAVEAQRRADAAARATAEAARRAAAEAAAKTEELRRQAAAAADAAQKAAEEAAAQAEATAKAAAAATQAEAKAAEKLLADAAAEAKKQTEAAAKATTDAARKAAEAAKKTAENAAKAAKKQVDNAKKNTGKQLSNANKAAAKAARQVKRKFERAVKRAEGQLTKFRLSKKTCREIFRAARGTGKLSKPLEIAMKKVVAIAKKAPKPKFEPGKTGLSEISSFMNADASFFDQAQSAIDIATKKKHQLNKIFSPENICQKNGAWFVTELSKVRIKLAKRLKANISTTSPNSFALHDFIFTPAVAAYKRGDVYHGFGIAFDLGAMIGVTVGYEVVVNTRTNEARGFFTWGPTIGPAIGVDGAFQQMYYGYPGFSKAGWGDFPGKGVTIEVGPEGQLKALKGQSVKDLMGVGANLILATPFKRLGFMGVGYSVGGGIGYGVATVGFDYTKRLH